MSGQDIEKVLDAVVNISKKMRMPVLATTSRRTSVGIEDIIKARLGAFDDCRMLVIANQDNPPGTVEKILASSSTIIVSGESVSMVSEAASSGKRVLVFLPRARRRDSLAWPWQARHVRFLKNLEGGGFIILCRPQDIESAFYDKRPLRRLDDNSLVYEAVKRII
jgi:mitochondrial fission protein ELM1